MVLSGVAFGQFLRCRRQPRIKRYTRPDARPGQLVVTQTGRARAIQSAETPSHAKSASTRFLISSRIGRICSMLLPDGSSSSQSS